MDWLFNGLPIHALIVHFVVVVVPVAALCLALSMFWPAARRRLGIVTPLVALAALISVPIATQAGEALEEQVSETALSEAHVHMGEDLLPWSIAVFVVAVLQWVWFRYFTEDGKFAGRVGSRAVRTTITIVLAVAVVTVILGSVITVIVIGESGARAVWDSRIK
jgi:ethanolamine transporter EutH